MLDVVLNFFTKSKLITILDKLKDQGYKSSCSKGKLVARLETYDAAKIFQSMTVSQLDDLLTEHQLETSGKKSAKIKRLVAFTENGVLSDSSAQSTSQDSSWEEELRRLTGEQNWEERHAKEMKQFHRLLSGFLGEYSELQKVRWEQYSLNFNDGDACPFEIQYMYLHFPEGVAHGSWGSLDEMFDENNEEVTITTQMNKTGRLFWEILTLHQNALEVEFGNHTRVTAQLKRRKLSFDSEHYSDHD